MVKPERYEIGLLRSHVELDSEGQLRIEVDPQALVINLEISIDDMAAALHVWANMAGTEVTEIIKQNKAPGDQRPPVGVNGYSCATAHLEAKWFQGEFRPYPVRPDLGKGRHLNRLDIVIGLVGVDEHAAESELLDHALGILIFNKCISKASTPTGDHQYQVERKPRNSG